MSVQTAVAGPEVWVRGPTVNRPGGESAQRTMPMRAQPPRPTHRASCVGAHGGAGTTTLASALGVADLGGRWPAPVRGESGQVLLVARTHAAGLQAASRILKTVGQHQRPDVRVVALALVADAPGRLPRQLSQRVRVLGSAVRTVGIPWVQPWRLGERAESLPKEVVKLAEILGIRPDHREGAR